MKDNYNDELGALLGLFDHLEEHARNCAFHDGNRAIRRQLIEKYARTCFQACQTQQQVNLVGGLFVSLIETRTAPGLTEWLTSDLDEIEDALVGYSVREGRVSSEFIAVIWTEAVERGETICSTCGRKLRQHIADALNARPDELPHAFIRE
jgi:hypothetical protein